MRLTATKTIAAFDAALAVAPLCDMLSDPNLSIATRAAVARAVGTDEH